MTEDSLEYASDSDVAGTPLPDYLVLLREHEKLAARSATLAKELVVRRAAAMQDLVGSIVGWIDSYGLARGEVLAELRQVLAPQTKGPAKLRVIRYTDPACPGKVYKRGPVPAWMRERMASLQLDATNPEHRQRYKEAHLKVVG